MARAEDHGASDEAKLDAERKAEDVERKAKLEAKLDAERKAKLDAERKAKLGTCAHELSSSVQNSEPLVAPSLFG